MRNFNMQNIGRGTNGHYVQIGDLEIWTSYQTVIAFREPRKPIVARINDWSSTTGRHMNDVPCAKEDRIDGEEFERLFKQCLDDHGLL